MRTVSFSAIRGTREHFSLHILAVASRVYVRRTPAQLNSDSSWSVVVLISIIFSSPFDSSRVGCTSVLRVFYSYSTRMYLVAIEHALRGPSSFCVCSQRFVCPRATTTMYQSPKSLWFCEHLYSQNSYASYFRYERFLVDV